MANFADDTNVEVLEKETPIQDEQVVDDADKVETPVEEEVQEEKPEEVAQPDGPTPAMRELAKQWIPSGLLDTAKDDEQLQAWINMARKEGAPPPVEEVPDFELSLPEDEFEASDAVRKQFAALNDYYKGKFKETTKDMGNMVSMINHVQEKQEALEQERHDQHQRAFDRVLDKMDVEIVGQCKDLDTGQRTIRAALYDQVREHQQKNGGDTSTVTDEIAAKMLRGVQTKQQKQAYQSKVKDQANGRLGTGNSPRMPELELTPEQGLAQFITKLNDKRR